MAEFVNAAPRFIPRGAEDNSTRQVLPESLPLPQHLPLFYIMAEKGPSGRVITNTSFLPLLYGKKTFSKIDKYYNHQTKLLEKVAGNGNTVMVQRIIPDDAGVRANAIIYMDVLEVEDLPLYARNSKGDYVANDNGVGYKLWGSEIVIPPKNPSADPSNPDSQPTTQFVPSTTKGYMIKFIKEYQVDGEELELGQAKTKQGYMQKNGKWSTMYPIFEAKAKYQGEAYNNIGFAISTPTADAIDKRFINATKNLEYYFTLYKRATVKDKPIVVNSLSGEAKVSFSLKANAIHPATEANMGFENVFPFEWYNETDKTKPTVFEEFDGIYFYRENYESLLKKFIDTEKTFITDEDYEWDDKEITTSASWFDFTTTDYATMEEEKGLINPFTCKSSGGTRYFTIALNTDDLDKTNQKDSNAVEVAIGSNTPILLSGGKDGTLSIENYEKGVVRKLDEYLDQNSRVQDLAINVESMLYDTGFELETKKELTSFIGLRKDTFIVLGTYIDSIKRKMPLSQHRAIAQALKTRLRLVPESEFYGTSVCRALVLMGSGLLKDNRDRVSQVYELGDKASKMMGAGDGRWKSSELFDNAPGNIINNLIECDPEFIPEGMKSAVWDDGIAWSQPYDRESFHFPGLQTVYENDTSVLNSFFTAFALCTLTKIAAKVHREFTGSTSLTDAQFKDAVRNRLNELTAGIFGGMFIIVHEVVITAKDKLRGYSWHYTSKLYANNMKTVGVFNSAAYRMSDLV